MHVRTLLKKALHVSIQGLTYFPEALLQQRLSTCAPENCYVPFLAGKRQLLAADMRGSLVLSDLSAPPLTNSATSPIELKTQHDGLIAATDVWFQGSQFVSFQLETAMATARPSRPQKTAEPVTDLEFVSISHPDDMKNRITRRKISRHVMKDIGMSRRKSPTQSKTRSGTLQQEPTNVDLPVSIVCESHTHSCQYKALDPFKGSPVNALSRVYAARAQSMQAYCKKTL